MRLTCISVILVLGFYIYDIEEIEVPEKKIYTAEEFSNRPAKAYREADKGVIVIINNSRYPDVVFELTARERGKGESSDNN